MKPSMRSPFWAGLTLVLTVGLLASAGLPAAAAPAPQVRATPSVPPVDTAAPGSAPAVWDPPPGGIRLGLSGGGFNCDVWQVVIPAGVAPDDGQLYCGVPAAAELPAAPAGLQLLQRPLSAVIYDAAGQSMASFLLPLSVCVPLRESDLTAAGDAANLVVAAAPAGGAWTALTTTVNVSARRACATVDHLSFFDLAVRGNPAASPAASTDYVIQPGDTLFRLSLRFGTTVAELMALNSLDSILIYPEQILKLPARQPAAPAIPAPSTPAAPVSSAAPLAGQYVVQPGDTLFRIGLRYGTTAAAIQAVNGLAGITIYPGQALTIPGIAAAPVSPPAAPVSVPSVPTAAPVQPTAAAQAPAGAYVVQPGDTLFRLSLRFDVTVAALWAANGLTSNLIYPGQALVIPGVTAAGGAAATSVPAVSEAATPTPVPAAVSDAATATPAAAVPATATPAAAATAAPVVPTAAPSANTAGVNHLGTEKVVLADYVMWYGPDNFDGNQTWDIPAAGPYNSDDAATIQRHVAQAQQACLNGFAAHWYGPTEARTTANFNQLLAASAGTSLRHAIVIQTNILPDASEQKLIDAINYVGANWAQSPNYLRLGGRPVLIFTDMPRPWGDEASARAGWARIRAAADPNHTMIWMAEGLTAAYNPLFDGLYVYRIDHRDYPQAWLKQPRWAAALRAAEQASGTGLYFADTIAAGFDDTRSVNASGDLRSDAPHFARDRQNGAYYAATFAATATTGGDFLLVKSFNEWIEGTEIEPGRSYGDLYLNLTCQYANTYRGR